MKRIWVSSAGRLFFAAFFAALMSAVPAAGQVGTQDNLQTTETEDDGMDWGWIGLLGLLGLLGLKKRDRVDHVGTTRRP